MDGMKWKISGMEDQNIDEISLKKFDIPYLEELKNLGFEHSDEGKHHKFVFSNDGRYSATISKTSSDYRAGKNFSRDVANQIFK